MGRQVSPYRAAGVRIGADCVPWVPWRIIPSLNPSPGLSPVLRPHANPSREEASSPCGWPTPTVTVRSPQLREHVVAGRLTLDEFSDRVGRALGATTRADLDAVMADLPSLSAQVAEPESGVEPVPPRQRRRWHVAVMSGHDTKGRWRISGQTNAIAVMGGCDLDLRYAEIEGPEVVITAFAFWGGIQVTVPEGFDVELSGFSFMGGRSLKTRDVPLIPGSPRITVRGFAIMGGIDVRSRPSRSARSGGSGRSRRRARDLPEAPAAAAAAAAGTDELGVGPPESVHASVSAPPSAPEPVSRTEPPPPPAPAPARHPRPGGSTGRPGRRRHRRHRDHPVLRHGRLRRHDRAPR